MCRLNRVNLHFRIGAAYLIFLSYLYNPVFISYLYNPVFIKVHFVYSVQVLLSRLNFFGSKQISNAENEGLKSYRDTAESVICGLIPDSPQATASRTGGTL